MSRNPLITVVSPVYQAEKIIPLLVKRIVDSLNIITDDFEIILVEDCGDDNSWEIIQNECAINSKIKGIKLSRNFGQHYAITAGIDYACGDWIVIMDCDLQDRPEEIRGLYEKAITGFQIVQAKRNDRQDNLFKKYSSLLFYKVLSYLTGKAQDSSIANFGIYHKSVIKSLKEMREPFRYFPTMVKWVGFKSTTIDVLHSERHNGQTTYSWKKLFRLALDVILSNSDKPIRMIVKLGFLIAFLSFIIGLFSIYRFFTHQIIVPGYTSLLISIWFIGGMILCVLGIIGLYIGKIFEVVKNRPIYIIDQSINIDD